MPYSPEDISTIDAFIGYLCVNERGVEELKLPGYFEGVSSEIVGSFSTVRVRDRRGRLLRDVLVTVTDSFNDTFTDETNANGVAVIETGSARTIVLKKNKVRMTYTYTTNQSSFELILDYLKFLS